MLSHLHTGVVGGRLSLVAGRAVGFAVGVPPPLPRRSVGGPPLPLPHRRRHRVFVGFLPPHDQSVPSATSTLLAVPASR